MNSHTLCLRMHLVILDSWRSYIFIREPYSFCVDNMNNMNRSLSFSSCLRKHGFHSYFEMQHMQLSSEFTFKLKYSEISPSTRLGMLSVY